MEKTLSIIKPDAVERNLENDIKAFFEKNNLKIQKSKKVKISKEEASEFYKVHQTKPFYNDLCKLFIIRSYSCYDIRRRKRGIQK